MLNPSRAKTHLRCRLRGRCWHVAALVCLGLLMTFHTGNTEARLEDGGEPGLVPATPATLIFAVSGDSQSELSMDAVVIVDDGKLRRPYDDDDETAMQQFAREHFQPGQTYQLTFGGGGAGTATVTKFDKGCNNIHANVTASTSVHLGGAVKELATDSVSFTKRPSARRAPTAAERTAVLGLVRRIYAQHGVTSAQYRSLKVTNLAATDLDGDGRFELIGSFALATRTKAERDLFLIAKQEGTEMHADFTKFQAYQPPPEGFLSSIDFVDQLDLDGDGTGEVFGIQGGFDGYGYVIFKRAGGRWRQVYEALGDAC